MNIIQTLYHPTQKFDDQKVYDLISSGKCKGLFQLESGLLKSYCKKLRPKNIENLSSLISIVRPGSLEAIDPDTEENMAIVFCKRANKELPVTYLHPELESILRDTYGVLVYQEQAMDICKKIAGFNLQEADELRKAAGKKIPEEMAKVKVKFLEGCKKEKKVDEESMNKIWDWIEKSQRYSFNKSHSMSYAILSYISAYLKVYRPPEFYCAWLRHANGKANRFEEVNALLQDAKLANYTILLPSLKRLNSDFEVDEETIQFGLSNIRGISHNSFQSLELTFKGKLPIIWDDFVLAALDSINFGVITGLIYGGALDVFRVSRTRMYYEYNNYREIIKDNYLQFIRENYKDSIINTLKSINETTKINNRKILKKSLEKIRSLINIIENPLFKLIDSIDFLSVSEENYLGIEVSCSKIDDKEISSANCSISDIIKGNVGEYICVGGVLDRISPYEIKKGKNKGQVMAFITVSDIGGQLDGCVCFADAFKEYEGVLTEKNTVLLRGKYQKDKKSLIIEKAWQV